MQHVPRSIHPASKRRNYEAEWDIIDRRLFVIESGIKLLSVQTINQNITFKVPFECNQEIYGLTALQLLRRL